MGTDLQMDSSIPQSLLRSSKDLKHRKPCVKPLLPQRAAAFWCLVKGTILDLLALFYLQVTVINSDLTEKNHLDTQVPSSLECAEAGRVEPVSVSQFPKVVL